MTDSIMAPANNNGPRAALPPGLEDWRLGINQAVNGLQRIERGAADAPLIATLCLENLRIAVRSMAGFIETELARHEAAAAAVHTATQSEQQP